MFCSTCGSEINQGAETCSTCHSLSKEANRYLNISLAIGLLAALWLLIRITNGHHVKMSDVLWSIILIIASVYFFKHNPKTSVKFNKLVQDLKTTAAQQKPRMDKFTSDPSHLSIFKRINFTLPHGKISKRVIFPLLGLVVFISACAYVVTFRNNKIQHEIKVKKEAELRDIDTKLAALNSEQQSINNKWNDYNSVSAQDGDLTFARKPDGTQGLISIGEVRNELRQRFVRNKNEISELTNKKSFISSTLGRTVGEKPNLNDDEVHFSLENDKYYIATMNDIGASIPLANRVYLNNSRFKIYVNSVMAMKRQRSEASSNWTKPLSAAGVTSVHPA
jgi:predicted nucleic acid-binding Zn ribbon protein